MKNIKWIRWYSLIIGTIIIITWIFILLNGGLPEGKTELSFHISSEFLMAFLCIIGGVFIHKNRNKGFLFSLVGFAMIIYSTMNAVGYYFEHNNLIMVTLLSVIFLQTLFSCYVTGYMIYSVLNQKSIII